MKSPILGSAYVARSVNAADNRCVNLFPEVIPEGGKEPAFLNRAPGLRQLNSIGTGPIRGQWQFGAYLYVASGSKLYKVDSSYAATELGTINGSSGYVSMVDNGTQLFVACNGPSYIYNASTDVFAQITDADFPGAGMVGYLDGYFVFNEPNSQRIWVTSLFDGTSIDPLDFASAEASPDGVVGLIVDHREVWIFGSNSTEVWYNSGGADFPLSRIQGAFNELGCTSAPTIAKLDNSLFWLGEDDRGHGVVYRANGYVGQRVSTHAIEWQIQQYPRISDALGYSYQQDGHSFYVMTFPSGNATWVYDVATGVWHERASLKNGVFARHRGDNHAFFNGESIVGDYENGNLYALDLNNYAEAGAIQKWLRSWRALPTGQNNLKRTAQHSLQIDMEAGVGIDGSVAFAVDNLLTEGGDKLITEDGVYIINDALASVVQGYDPQIMLRWSDDGGHTWSNEHWVKIGKLGEYGKRVIFRRLGMTQKLRDRVYEISGTDTVKIAIMGAELIVSGTNA